MKVVFFGASELGYRCCEALIENGFDVRAIFTTPEKFNISYSKGKPVTNYLFKDFHSFEKAGIPVKDVEGKMDSYIPFLESLSPDIIVVIGWYYLVPVSVRRIPKLGTIGIHGSLLPKYRGGAPLVWAMINGEKEAGLSLFYLEDGVDTGDIIDQRALPIEEEDTIKEMLVKLEKASLEILLTNMSKLRDGTATRRVQDESQATYVPQRKPEDGQINWEWEPARIKNFIRAQTRPYPGAFTIINDKKINIWDADITQIDA